MRRLILIILMLGMALMMSQGVLIAQDDESSCTADAIPMNVEALMDDYGFASIIDSDLESALASLETLIDDLEGLYDSCNAVLLSEFADDAQMILDLLYEGGYVVYVRHTTTDRSQSDTDLAQCETQRNLNEQGRDEARDIGIYYVTLNIPVSRLISTQYCRTLETAQLAFGEPEIINRDVLGDQLNDLLATAPDTGTNTFIVAHIGTLGVTTITVGAGGDTLFEEGDSLIFQPLGDDGYDLVGRIPLNYWEVMATLITQDD